MKTAIGLEIHVQLKTKSKMFCGCDNFAVGKKENTLICPVCLGYPGVLPVPNKEAVLMTVKTGLALDCKINHQTHFDRKHYFYPDLPKNYQISQYSQPIAEKGKFKIWVDSKTKTVRIKRVHLEEDAAKLVHSPTAALVDFNRSGTPLMEIVTEPDIETPEEARAFLQQLRAVLVELGVSNADLEKGEMRCDANVSVSKTDKLGTPVEIKNMNSYRAVYQALSFEIERLSLLVEKGEKIKKETRGWDETKKQTLPQRTKETAPDYRYFPEPDIPPIVFTAKEIAKIKAEIPTLPFERRKKLIQKYQLPKDQASILALEPVLGQLFEDLTQEGIKAKTVANFLTGPVVEKIKLGLDPAQINFLAILKILKAFDKREITNLSAKEIFEKSLIAPEKTERLIKKATVTADSGTLEELAKKIVKENPQAVSDFKKGKNQALGFLIGQAMQKTQGKIDPIAFRKVLKKLLK